MRIWRTLTCLLILALTFPAAAYLKRELPSDVQPMIEKKYSGWSGVLRLWIQESWPVGSNGISAWINRCIASFEKQHAGVYIQPEYVDAGALSAEGLLPPDIVLFPPGTIDRNLLAPLNIDLPIRDGLPRDDRAAPVLLSGYLWAYNVGLIDGIPNSWRDIGLPVATPLDDPGRLWSAALLALCSSKYSADDPVRQDAPQGSIDLGIEGNAPEEAAAPTPVGGTLSCALPEGFEPDTNAWQSFINGEAAALLVTPREIQRLEALSDQGKGPDWQLAPAGDAAFSDQVLYIGALDQQNQEKLALCRDFIAHLLDDACQGELHRVGSFPVTDVSPGYAPGDPLQVMAQQLLEKPLVIPGPFDTAWRRDASDIVRDFWRSGPDPAAVLASLAERIRQ